MSSVSATLIATAVAAPAVAILLRLEKTRPIEPEHPRGEILMDYWIVALNVATGLCLTSIVGGYAAECIRAVGGGFVALRSDGWWFAVSLSVVILAGDFFAYLVHRAQHAIPTLWAMHSLHHSAACLTLVTGARHFWVEQFLILALYTISIGMLFTIPPDIRIAAGFIYFLPDACAHLNIRIPFGRFSGLVNNPQYHRIHHSVCPQHRNKNFCKLLPIFDVIFGTAWLPGADEFPATGLRYQPAGIVDAALWPLRPHVDKGIQE
jgi:sterol desaturase/sphingolipid hydroxylase (fatty acid hydroxylase superfamily)